MGDAAATDCFICAKHRLGDQDEGGVNAGRVVHTMVGAWRGAL